MALYPHFGHVTNKLARIGFLTSWLNEAEIEKIELPPIFLGEGVGNMKLSPPYVLSIRSSPFWGWDLPIYVLEKMYRWKMYREIGVEKRAKDHK